MAKKQAKETKQVEQPVAPVTQPATRNNAVLFTDDQQYNNLITLLLSKITKGKTDKDCAKWDGKVWEAKTKNCNILRFGSHPFFDAQKLLWIHSRNLRAQCAERGSAAIGRVTTNCGNLECMNPAHLVEKAAAAPAKKVEEPKVEEPKAETPKPKAAKARKAKATATA